MSTRKDDDRLPLPKYSWSARRSLCTGESANAVRRAPMPSPEELVPSAPNPAQQQFEARLLLRWMTSMGLGTTDLPLHIAAVRPATDRLALVPTI